MSAEPIVDAGRAGHMLERASWAAREFATYGVDDVRRIVEAAAHAGAAHAQELAEMAVEETTFGVVEHKVEKNVTCSVGLLDVYDVRDYVEPVVDASRKTVSIPRPAGVIVALTPSTNPVASVFFKGILGLMTRNAVIVSPHPMAKNVCVRAVALMEEAAVGAGAPDGILQCVEHPSVPLVDELMADDRCSLVVATGGSPMVRAAYRSGTPALGVGPGNVPVMVDATADIDAAAREIVDSKAFDNSVLCTNESVLIVEESVREPLLRAMERQGAMVLSEEEAVLLADYMFPLGRLNTEVVGKDASWIAERAGFRAGPRTRVLLAPFDAVLPENAMTREKLSPVLGVTSTPTAAAAIEAARAVVRMSGRGHSASIHSSDPATVARFTERVPVLRVSVNVGNSKGGAGLTTGLAPTMTIGTGFMGGSGLSENLEPKHLMSWARIAYGSGDDHAMPSFAGLDVTTAHEGRVPVYPLPSNDPAAAISVTGNGRPRADAPARGSLVDAVAARVGGDAVDARVRAEVRRIVAEELQQLLKG